MGQDINTGEFWDAVDVDEMAALDVPSILTHVLKSTGAAKMHWVGHSQGGGMPVFALAKDPSLQERLGTMVLLAPGVHMKYLKVPLLKFLSNHHVDEFWHQHGGDIPGIETHRYYFPGPVFSKVMEFFTGHTPLCRISVRLCNAIGKILGISVGRPRNLDPKTMANAYKYDPGGASFHLLMHWAQRIREDTLLEFDWGVNNSKHYNGSQTPPAYDLGKIAGMRMLVCDGGRDLFITPKNINPLLVALKKRNSIVHKTYKDYAHMDFVWGKDAHTRLYPAVIRMLSNERVQGNEEHGEAAMSGWNDPSVQASLVTV